MKPNPINQTELSEHLLPNELSEAKRRNVKKAERWGSIISGALLALDGLRRKNFSGLGELLIGAALLERGVTGYCRLYGALNINTAERATAAQALPQLRTLHIEQTYTINRSPEELYRVWSNFENLPRFMKHLESVTQINERCSHWKTKGPAGTHIEWDAEIVQQTPNEYIAWQSLAGSDITHAGSVRFQPASDGGTEVQVTLEYAPPGGIIGSKIAKLFGEEPTQQIRDDLRRFKQYMEAGDISAKESQAGSLQFH